MTKYKPIKCDQNNSFESSFHLDVFMTVFEFKTIKFLNKTKESESLSFMNADYLF